MSGTASIGQAEASILSGTVAADSAGDPLVFHHGTVHRFSEFRETADIGFHFGTREQARKRLVTMPRSAMRGGSAAEGRIVSAALAVRRPLLLLDDPLSWQPGYVGGVLGRLLGRRFQGEPSVRDIRRMLADEGYDAVCYRNIVESSKGSRSLEFSWVVMSPGQVVILGEDVRADKVRLPLGMARSAGFDPAAAARKLGGLRFRSGGLQSAADRKAFSAMIGEAMAEVLPDAEAQARYGDGKKWTWDEGEVRVGVDMLCDIGRVCVEVEGMDGREAGDRMLEGLPYDHCHRTDSRPDRVAFWCEWVPGEPLEAVAGRCREAVEKVAGRAVAALGLAP